MVMQIKLIVVGNCAYLWKNSSLRSRIIIIIIEITKKVDYAVCTFLTMYLVAIIPHVNSFMSYRGLAPRALWNEVLQEKSGRKSGSASAL